MTKLFKNSNFDTVEDMFVLIDMATEEIHYYLTKMAIDGEGTIYKIASYDEFNRIETQALYLNETKACTDFFDLFTENSHNLEIMSWQDYMDSEDQTPEPVMA